jgi:hypothetical protein
MMNEFRQRHFLKIILVFIALIMAFRLDLAAETTGV